MICCPSALVAVGSQATCSLLERTLVGGIGEIAVTVMPLSLELKSGAPPSRRKRSAINEDRLVPDDCKFDGLSLGIRRPESLTSNSLSAFITNDPDLTRRPPECR